MKSQKGAATLYVLIAMLVFTAIAIGVFITSANKQQMQLEAIRATQRLYDTGETASQAYLKYMGGEVIPISNAKELLQAGSGNTVYIEGRTYVFDTDKLYVLKDDITLQEEDKDRFAQLQQKLSDGTVVIESQGYTISLIIGGVARIYSGNDNFQDYIGNQYTLAYNTQEGSTAPEEVTQGSKDFTITDVVPTKTGYVFNGWNTEQDGSGTRYKAGNTITINENTTLYAQWVIEVTNFDYVEDQNGTGYAQTFIVPATGTYMLETWGAQGGNVSNEGETYHGGYGAYSTGTIYLTEDTLLNVVIGGMGRTTYSIGININSENKANEGGYNGGGSVSYPFSSNVNATQIYATGGGCTHIAYQDNQLKELKEYTTEAQKNNILIVSSGGGGAVLYMNPARTSFHKYNGNSGGGIVGGTNEMPESAYTYSGVKNLTAPTQSNGGEFAYSYSQYNNSGSFGQGGNCTAGGGAGYYGGPGTFFGGIGGTSYLKNILSNKHMTGYNVQTSSEESTRTITTTNVSQTPISDYAKQGNGYARITFLHGED